MNSLWITFLLVATSGISYSAEEKKNSPKTEAIKKVIKDNIAVFKKCYHDESAKNPSLNGQIIIGWNYSDQGTVTKTWLVSSQMANKAVEDCLLEKVKTLQFPGAPEGALAEVQYPFLFKKVQD